MKYDFDVVVDRSKNCAAKYDERKKKFGTDDVIPLWIADMDFKTAQPIIDALKARAEEGIWGYTARPDSYFEAIRGWQKRRNGWDIDQSLMSFSLGVVQTISAMVKLFTPEGGSVLIQTPVYSEFYDMTEAWNRKVLENQFMEKDGKWRFTSPTHVVLAFSKALDELEAEGGIPARHRRYAENNRLLIEKMRAMGFTPYIDGSHQGPIITTFFYPAGVSFQFSQFYTYIKERGYVLYPGKLTDADTFRVGNIGEIYPEDMEKLTAIIAGFLAAHKEEIA